MTRRPAVCLVVEAGRAPIRYEEPSGKLSAEFPSTPPERIHGLLRELLRQRVLISGLHALSTAIDAFEHLMEQLEAVGAADFRPVADFMQAL